MAFITNSVGLGGRNSPPDVTIIQWMLIQAQNNYRTNLFDAAYTLSESGTVDNQTGLAIKAIISYPRRSISSPLLLAPVLQPQNSYSFSFLSSSVISPDDENYKFLLKCTPKPICTIPLTNIKIDFNDDPLVVQALVGTLNFQAFKSAVEAKDGSTCGESNGSNFCGVNPVTRRPGINAVASGILGELRPGIGGNGNFHARTGNKHDAIDIRAPVGTPIYACRAGVVEEITGPSGGMGNRVILKHSDGIFTHYAHLSSFAPGIEVKNPRVEVTEGQLLGYAGRTGNVPTDQLGTEDHVHFGVNTIVRPAFQGPEWRNPVRYLNECVLTANKGNN